LNKPAHFSSFRTWLQLLRPPNLVTAVSDIWAGIALAGVTAAGAAAWWQPLLLLSLASVCLYGGGVVINDVCDAKLDKKERPERAIPSGRISKAAAARFGGILLLAGILLAACHSFLSAGLALLVAGAAVTYDVWGKHHLFFGPLNMGICRGLDLLLGMTLIPDSILHTGWVAVIPVIYIAAITLISRGEVHGGSRPSLIMALVSYFAVFAAVALVGFYTHRPAATAIFLLLFAVMIVPPVISALQHPSPRRFGQAVKAGVLAIILLNAAWVAAGSGLAPALATALLLPVSLWLSGRFAVT
jgi:4-hydroxybenzoate polyprenyltransferase